MQSNNEYLKLLGMEIKIARIRKGYTLNQVAKQTGLSKSAVGSLERGESDFKILTLKRIADILEKPLVDFFIVLPNGTR